MDKFKTPKLENFYQGMKYQVAHDVSFMIWDAKTGVTEESGSNRFWLDREVYWMGDSVESHTECSEYGCVTVDSPTYDYFYRTAPFNIESMIEQKLIRVKDNYEK